MPSETLLNYILALEWTSLIGAATRCRLVEAVCVEMYQIPSFDKNILVLSLFVIPDKSPEMGPGLKSSRIHSSKPFYFNLGFYLTLPFPASFLTWHDLGLKFAWVCVNAKQCTQRATRHHAASPSASGSSHWSFPDCPSDLSLFSPWALCSQLINSCSAFCTAFGLLLPL